MGIQSAAKCKRERLAEYEDYMSESSAGGSIGGIGIARIGFAVLEARRKPHKGRSANVKCPRPHLIFIGRLANYP